jgi:hypothetical protein
MVRYSPTVSCTGRSTLIVHLSSFPWLPVPSVKHSPPEVVKHAVESGIELVTLKYACPEALDAHSATMVPTTTAATLPSEVALRMTSLRSIMQHCVCQRVTPDN